MVLSEGEDKLNKKHADLCNKLNLDPDIVTVSWDNFRSINKNFVLEGDALHWLGCSIFVASRSIRTPLSESATTKGCCINLTILLKLSNLSFEQFLCNINKWAEMAHLPEDFLNNLTHLKDTFGVTYSTFKEYYSLFAKIFVIPSIQELDQQKQHRNRKHRSLPCNGLKVFEFIWNLFVTLKSGKEQYSMELIKSYHLLYACLDLAFKNAFYGGHRDLLNPQFECLPADWNSPSFVLPAEAPCLISYLCKCSSMITDAMHMKMYILKNMITNLIKDRILLANQTDFTGMFNDNVFEQNFKNITNMYENLLNGRDFDERSFLGEIEVGGSPKSCTRMAMIDSVFPFSRKELLGSMDDDIVPLSKDKTTQKITRLHNIINSRSPGPSETLLQLFESCQKDPIEKIKNILKILGDKFVTAYLLNNTRNIDDAKCKLQLSVTLFYKYIENVLENEKNIHKDISPLVDKDLFYQCIFTCCVEIVLFCYDSPKKFPWILDALEVEPFQFVKVIELIVRSKDQLSRDVIKHLNKIEETVIESLVWKSTSQLWDVIAFTSEGIPRFEDIALPGHILYNEHYGNKTIQHSDLSDNKFDGLSATDCFQSPITRTSVNGQFATFQAGQSLLQKQINKDGNKRNILLIDGEKPPQQNEQNVCDHLPTLPRRTGSLPIIFRKFYNLAGVRMEHLCRKLDLTDMELKQKIWTVFEDSIRNTDLIKDRHLDQLLMCAVYVICKVSGSVLKFQEIMKYYREQPQSISDVYRDVLLTGKKVEPDGTIIPAKRSDLIHFYNSIYVNVMQKFAVKFRNSVQNSSLLLSPLPSIKRDLVSPSIQVVENVFVTPLDSPSTTCSTSFNYFFSRSPSKDLKDINKLVNNSGVTGKRLLIEGDMDIPPSKRISNRKLQSLVEERQSQHIIE